MLIHAYFATTVSGQDSSVLVNGEQPDGFAISLPKSQKAQYGQQFGEGDDPSTPGIIGNLSNKNVFILNFY